MLRLKQGSRAIAWGILVSALVMTACTESSSLGPQPGSELALYVGQSALVANGQLQVTFLSVSSDNRCPPGLQCVIAGSATVTLHLSRAHVSGDLALTTNGTTSRGIFQGYRITLLDLSPPLPRDGFGPIQVPYFYRVKLEVASALD
jgi:hypothetical protein